MSIQSISQLLADHRIWSASQKKQTGVAALSSGYESLDHCLNGGGWPLGTLIECQSEHTGIGELQVFLPAMRNLCNRQDKAIFWVDPPHLPYPPAMINAGLVPQQFYRVQSHEREERLWALEQLLRCPAVGLVMGWSDTLDNTAARRLQLAAEAGKTLGVIMTRYSTPSAPPPLRLSLAPENGQLQVRIRRQRGGQGAVTALSFPLQVPL